MMESPNTTVRTLPALVIASAMAAFIALPAAAQTAGNVKCNGCVSSRDVKNNGIKSKDIKDGQVGNVDLGADAVDGAKVLDGSLTSVDILDSAGADFAETDALLDTINATDTVYETITINAPTDGVVIASASAFVNITSTGIARCAVTTGTTLGPIFFNALGNTTGVAAAPVTIGITRGFVVSAGATTLNLVCNLFSGTATMADRTLTAIFVPDRI